MTKMEMANEVATAIEAKGIKAKAIEVNKNGIMFYGVTMGDGNVRPTMYIQEVTEDVNSIADKFIDSFNNLPSNNYDTMVSDFTNFELIKRKIIPVLIMRDNDSLLSRKFLDLTLIYKIVLSDDATVSIKKEHISIWNVSEEDIYNIAIENAKDTFVVKSMAETLGMPALDDGNLMNVVTNKKKIFGGSALLYPELFTDMYNEYGKLAILPSSIHEVLVMKYELPESLNDMVKDVNKAEVRPEEWLSDHIYVFDGKAVTLDA